MALQKRFIGKSTAAKRKIVFLAMHKYRKYLQRKKTLLE